MQKLFNLFYKEVGTRRIQNLASPKLIDFISFPRNSVYHHHTRDDGRELDVSKLYFKGYKTKIAVDYITESIFTDGGVRKVNLNIKNLIRDFFNTNKQFQYRPDALSVVKDSGTLIVENYNYLNDSYKYIETSLTPYYKFLNHYRTILSNMALAMDKNDRQHFFFVNTPREIPALSFIVQFSSSKPSTGMLTIFNNEEKLLILEMFKWLNTEKASESIFSVFKKSHLSRINFVFFSRTNKASILNLGYLHGWVKGNDLNTNSTDKVQVEDNDLQKLFLKFLLSINFVSDVEEITEHPTDQDNFTLKTRSDSELGDDFDENFEISPEFTTLKTTPVIDLSPSSINTSIPSLDEIPDDLDSDISTDETIAALLNQIEQDLSVTEKKQKITLSKKGISIGSDGDLVQTKVTKEMTEEQITSEVFGDKTYREGLLSAIEAAADTGRLSAAEYRKFLTAVSDFENMPDPYKTGKVISEVNKVTVNDIVINDSENEIVTSEMMIDKTMGESSLQTFDSKYIKNVLSKDMLMMVSSIQKAGVVIASYEIETERSIAGTYQVHEIQLKPVDGAGSTLRFRVPVPDENGVMKVGGSLYSYRKQIVDLPVRKIDPVTVALSSYYGKTFVAVSDKKANSSYDWLLRNISKLSILDNPVITDLGPADVFNNLFKAPYLYSFLSKNYKTFKIKGNTFVFDERERSIIYPNFSKIEKNGSVVCGFTETSEPIVMSETEEFLIYRAGGYVSLGNIETMLGIDKTKSPVDFTELRVFAKTVPVGVVLGYYIGFGKLLKLIKAEYRAVEGRSLKNLQADEYVVAFSDTSYIFTRKQRAVSLMVSGFLEYEKVIKQFPVETFNDKDVYFNLFDSKSMSALYIRELDIYRQLFIDGITKTILEQMGLPVTFEGLLVKSTEMLCEYGYPDTQDMNHMRIRGYERIPGIVYSQLATAIRQYRTKNISGRSKIEMSPFAVWSTIMKDPAIKLVEDINPIQNMKESEIVTYVGEGGRGKESMNKATRAFHVSNVGVVSEASVDSGDVGINFYLSSNPNFKDMRGIVKSDKKITPTSMVSTATMLAPGSSKDD